MAVPCQRPEVTVPKVEVEVTLSSVVVVVPDTTKLAKVGEEVEVKF